MLNEIKQQAQKHGLSSPDGSILTNRIKGVASAFHRTQVICSEAEQDGLDVAGQPGLIHPRVRWQRLMQELGRW